MQLLLCYARKRCIETDYEIFVKWSENKCKRPTASKRWKPWTRRWWGKSQLRMSSRMCKSSFCCCLKCDNAISTTKTRWNVENDGDHQSLFDLSLIVEPFLLFLFVPHGKYLHKTNGSVEWRKTTTHKHRRVASRFTFYSLFILLLHRRQQRQRRPPWCLEIQNVKSEKCFVKRVGLWKAFTRSSRTNKFIKLPEGKIIHRHRRHQRRHIRFYRSLQPFIALQRSLHSIQFSFHLSLELCLFRFIFARVHALSFRIHSLTPQNNIIFKFNVDAFFRSPLPFAMCFVSLGACALSVSQYFALVH